MFADTTSSLDGLDACVRTRTDRLRSGQPAMSPERPQTSSLPEHLELSRLGVRAQGLTQAGLLSQVFGVRELYTWAI